VTVSKGKLVSWTVCGGVIGVLEFYPSKYYIDAFYMLFQKKFTFLAKHAADGPITMNLLNPLLHKFR